jgi:predicted regulator of Ras-like GTPase activity (Roadblock/LC7/MglB family)
MVFSAQGAPRFVTAGGGPAGVQQPPHIGPKNQIIVLSDFADAAWRRPPIWQMLHRWGASAPTLLVNPLPPRIWRQVGVDLPAVRVTSRGVPAAPNAHLDYHRPWYLRAADKAEQVLTPLPVVALAPYALEDWARVVMSVGSAGGSGQPSCDALLVPAQGRFEDAGADADPVLFPVADELTKSSLAAFSPAAARLAVLYMSLPVITMPMAQLIRERMVPEASTADMAEVIVSGLLTTKTGSEPPTFRPRAAVRSEFQKLLGAADTWQLHDILSGYVESHGHSPTTLRAAVPDKAGTVRLSAELLPFAAASAETLRLLGVSSAGEDTDSLDQNKDVETPPGSAAQGAPETERAARNRLLDGIVSRLPSVIAVVLVSSDGRALAASSNVPEKEQSELATVCGGLIAICHSASRIFDGGGVVHTVVEMARGFLFITSASADTYLAATASPDCDMGLVWYEMALFVERFGNRFARTGL